MNTAVLPKMEPVKSSNVEAVGHDPKTNELHVRFKGGGHYIYPGVSAATHVQVVRSKSVGGFIHEHIKGKHPHRKLG